MKKLLKVLSALIALFVSFCWAYTYLFYREALMRFFRLEQSEGVSLPRLMLGTTVILAVCFVVFVAASEKKNEGGS